MRKYFSNLPKILSAARWWEERVPVEDLEDPLPAGQQKAGADEAHRGGAGLQGARRSQDANKERER